MRMVVRSVGADSIGIGLEAAKEFLDAVGGAARVKKIVRQFIELVLV